VTSSLESPNNHTHNSEPRVLPQQLPVLHHPQHTCMEGKEQKEERERWTSGRMG